MINIEECRECAGPFVASIKIDSKYDEVVGQLNRGEVDFGGVPSFSACGKGPICTGCLDKEGRG